MPGPSTAALKKYQDEFEKSFGKGSLRTPKKNIYNVISTGSIALDRAMGCGGFILGRLTEVWGPPGGGKTSLCLTSAGIAQKTYKDRFVGFIDVEQTFDTDWAQLLGVNVDTLHVVTPATAEDVADIMKSMLESGFYSMIILDSVGAMLPKEEFEKDAEQVSVGTIAKIITRMVKIAAVYAPKQDTAVVIINQMRASLAKFGADTTTGGGFALKHVTTHKLNVKQSSSPYTIGSDDSKVNIGYEMGVKVERNKVAPAGRNIHFDFFTMETKKYGPVGIDRIQDAFKVGKLEGIIEQGGGGYYTLPDGERLRGEESAVEHIRANPKLYDTIREKILEKVADQVVSDEADQLTPEQINQLGDG